MPRVSLQGSSDDNFQLDGAVHDEVRCYEKPVVLQVKVPDDEPINIVGEYGYAGKGMWMIGLQVNDDETWPVWASGDNISWGRSRNLCTPKLDIEVPTGTVITQIAPSMGECGECGREYDQMEWVVK